MKSNCAMLETWLDGEAVAFAKDQQHKFQLSTPKRTAGLLILGLCIVIFAGATRPAYAEGVTGYGSFRVARWNPNDYLGAENCLTESYGAVVNKCPQSQFPNGINLLFALPANAGGHSVFVQALPNSNAAFSCSLWYYDGWGNGWATVEQSFPNPLGLTFNTNDGNDDSLELFCYNIPNGGGIANINWN